MCASRAVQDLKQERFGLSEKSSQSFAQFKCRRMTPQSVRGSPAKGHTTDALSVFLCRNDRSDHRSKGGCVNTPEWDVVV